jgi:hypothetical protein
MSDTTSIQSSAEVSDALKQKLAALKAQRAQLEAAKPEPTIEELILIEERLIREAEAVASARLKFGNKFATLQTPDGLVIVTRSGTVAFRQIQELENLNLERMQEFVTPCIYYPPREKTDKLCDDYPGAIPAMFAAISVLMGAVRNETAKK